MRTITITTENLNEVCITHLSEPATDGAPNRSMQIRCRACGEVIDTFNLPVDHECSEPERMEEPK